MDKATFTREIAEALHEIEGKSSAGARREDLIHITYQQLCYDDPVGISVQGCQQLQHALLKPNSPYALSTRLVAGIHQYSSRLKQLSSSQQLPPTSSLLVESENEISDTLGSAVALLAFCLHVEIPLQCCMAKTTLSQAAKYLGSYTAVPMPESVLDLEVEHADERPTVNDAVNIALNGNGALERSLAAVENNDFSNGHDTGFETNSLEELFAAESDDSDFEFESDWNPEAQTVDLNRWISSMEDSLNPLLLSQPSTSVTTWDDVAVPVAHLLESLPPTLFSAISSLHWKRGMSETMTQLCLALLVPASSKHSPLLTASSAVSSERWQRLGVRLVHAFREFTMHHVNVLTSISSLDPATCAATTSVLEDYLRLIRILLQVHRHSLVTKPTDGSTPAMLVGLSALSELCRNVQMPYSSSFSSKSTTGSFNGSRAIVEIVQSNVFQIMDDLTTWLECSMNKTKEDITIIQWTYLSLFEIFTVSTRIFTSSSALVTDTLPKDIAQGLLNSGLFRQWLVLWSQNIDASSQFAVQDCILDLSLASPSLLGKYAWRFPGLAQVVTSPEKESTLCTHDSADIDVSITGMLLWNVLGVHLAVSEVSVPKIQWKSAQQNNSDASFVGTIESCTLEARSLFQVLCANTLRILTDWKLRRQHNIDPLDGKNSRRWASYEMCCSDWKFLAVRISSIPFLCKLFTDILMQMNGERSSAESSDSSPKVRTELASIQRTLTDWPSADCVASADMMATISGKKSDDGDDDDGSDLDEDVGSLKKSNQKSRTVADHERMLLASLRKSTKTVQAAFDSCDDVASFGNIGSAQTSRLTSKMD
jgi:hypothetical protein